LRLVKDSAVIIDSIDVLTARMPTEKVASSMVGGASRDGPTGLG